MRAVVTASCAVACAACQLVTGLSKLDESNAAPLDADASDAHAHGDAAGAGTNDLRDAAAAEVDAPPGTFVLRVVVDGPAPGSGVVSSPQGILCGTIEDAATGDTCAFAFPAGTTVRLHQSPAPNLLLFLGWGEACSAAGTGTDCNVLMDADKQATASYEWD
jgi:hypothetical protein